MSIINKGTAFSNGEQLTADKLNDLVDLATFDQSATDSASTTVNTSGQIVVADSGVSTAKIAAGAVTTAKILDANVTFAKLTDVIDDDTMATATNTTLATSESIKAYVDSLALRVKEVSSTAARTLTAAIPLDNTVPQSTEGTEILTTTFTAVDSNNSLLIKFNGLLAGQTAGAGQVLALFRGTTCVGARWWAQPSDGTNLTSCHFLIDALNTSSNTYSIRYGPGVAGLISYVNTQGNVPGGASLGGFQEISMTIQEVNAT